MGQSPTILTIGHSRHSLERFVALLKTAEANAVADVRSAPASRFSPHFNKSALAESLAAQGIDYLYFGKELGGRPERPEMYTQGVVDYEKMAASPEFHAGLARLKDWAAERRVALMCAEADPLDCHRCLLVGHALAEAGHDVAHILASGDVVSHAEIEDRLLEMAKLKSQDLLGASRAERLAEAYRSRTRKAGYAKR